jgi:micrococcal nuclease
MTVQDKLGFYEAKIIRVVDGDTVDAEICVFPNLFTTQRLRFLGINTAELKSSDKKEKAYAIKAKDYVEDKLKGKTVIIKTTETDVFGRYLSVVYVDELDFNEHLIEVGMARPYVRKD